MITIGGKPYLTLADAVKEFGVSPKTVCDWIIKGIIPVPPQITWGVRTMSHFPLEYIKEAKVRLECYRKEKAGQRNESQNQREK